MYMERFIKKLIRLIETHLECSTENDSARRTRHRRRLRKRRIYQDEYKHMKLPKRVHLEPHCHVEPVHHVEHRRICNSKKDQIVEKIQMVAQQLQTNIAENTRCKMSDYFTEDASGRLVPIQVRIKSGEQTIQIPKFTLVNHSNVDLKEMKCKFRTDAYNLGIDCDTNFEVETEVIFEQNGPVDGYNRISELLIREYT